MTDDLFDQTFDVLFDGVDSLKNDGAPGTLIPLSSNTYGLLACENSKNMIMVAVRFGQGRCLIFSHNSYLSMFLEDESENEKFILNCREWFEADPDTKFESIDDSDSFEEVTTDGRILVWNGNYDKDKAFISDLCNYVNDGGSLVCGSTAWAWFEEEDDRRYSNFSFGQFCDLLGVRVTNSCIDCPDWIPVNRELVNFKNVQNVIQLLADDPTNDEYLEIVEWATKELGDTLPGLTMDIIEQVIESSEGQVVPDSESPIEDKTSRERSVKIGNILRSLPGVKAPGVEKFPGDFEREPKLEKDVEFSAKSDCVQWFCTGYYVAAGTSIRVDVLNREGAHGWSVRIGCHDDELDCCDELRRWSSITVCKKLDEDRVRLSSSFGGILFLESPEGESNSITVRLRHVVRTPTYDLTDPNRSETWESHRTYTQGLWADIAGRHIVFNLPSKSVLHMNSSELDRVLEFWDNVILAHHDLRGTAPKYRERVVCDEQPSVGYMHSGYPIVTQMNISDADSDDFVFNIEQLEKIGAWGLFHELGHNMQRDSWTFEGTEEVTVNLFTLHAMEKICDIEPWIHPWLEEQIDDTNQYIMDGCDFEKWKNEAGVALFIYAQLIREFGWDSFKAVFRFYESEADYEFDSEQAKIDRWVVIFSRQVHCNLVPLFKFWGFPISQSTVDSLTDLDPITTSDQFIDLAPERLEI